MVELNLLPDVKKEFIKAQRTRNMVTSLAILAILAAAGIIVLIALYVYGFQNGQIFLNNRAIEEDSKKLASIEEIDKYVTLQNQLTQLDELHNQKNVYSRFLDYFKTLNPRQPNQIALSAAEVAEDDTSIRLTGTTRSFESFNIFKDTLENAQISYQAEGSTEPNKEALFTNVVVESAALGEIGDKQGVSFSVVLTYNKQAFSYQATNLELKVPNIETTGSTQSAPQSLFGTGGDQ